MLGSQVQKSMEVPLGESEPRVLTSVEGQVGVSSSGAGLMPMSALGVQVTGKEAATRCSSDIVILDFGKADFPGFTDSNIEVTHRLGSRDSGFTVDMGFNSAGAVIEPPILTEVPPIQCRQPWLVQNRFSPLSVLGNGMEAEFGEREDHAEERSSTHVDTTQERSVDSVGEFQSDSGLHLLPGETSGVVVSGCGSGEKDIFVLDCEPLSRWEPKDLSEGLLVQDSVVGS